MSVTESDLAPDIVTGMRVVTMGEGFVQSNLSVDEAARMRRELCRLEQRERDLEAQLAALPTVHELLVVEAAALRAAAEARRLATRVRAAGGSDDE